MKKCKTLLTLLIAIVMITSVMSGCKSRDAAEDSPSAVSSGSNSKSSSSKPAPGEKTVSNITPDLIKYVTEKKGENADTVGWVQVPELTIDDVVVMSTDNKYYLRRNFEKKDEFNGVLFADFRSEFGDGTAAQLGTNTCIYGHAMTDDKTDSKYDIFFGHLHDLRDPEIAKTVPYMFFSTEKENLAFEIFAVFVANGDNGQVPYNRNDIPQADFVKMVKEEVLPRSIYNYDVEIKDDDKFLTLSTCIYTLPNGTPTNYPNTYMRYAVMGRLVNADDAVKTEATFEINNEPLIDPDGKVAK